MSNCFNEIKIEKVKDFEKKDIIIEKKVIFVGAEV